MLAVCMFYGWPALLTFRFSGNLALYYLCWIAVIIPYLSQINFFFFFITWLYILYNTARKSDWSALSNCSAMLGIVWLQ